MNCTVGGRLTNKFLGNREKEHSVHEGNLKKYWALMYWPRGTNAKVYSLPILCQKGADESLFFFCFFFFFFLRLSYTRENSYSSELVRFLMFPFFVCFLVFPYFPLIFSHFSSLPIARKLNISKSGISSALALHSYRTRSSVDTRALGQQSICCSKAWLLRS